MIDIEKALYRDPLDVALRAERVARGMTQRQLAAVSGIAQPSISEIERGGHGWTVATARRLAAALGFELALSPSSTAEVPDA